MGKWRGLLSMTFSVVRLQICSAGNLVWSGMVKAGDRKGSGWISLYCIFTIECVARGGASSDRLLLNGPPASAVTLPHFQPTNTMTSEMYLLSSLYQLGTAPAATTEKNKYDRSPSDERYKSSKRSNSRMDPTLCSSSCPMSDWGPQAQRICYHSASSPQTAVRSE